MISATHMNETLRELDVHGRYEAGAIAWNDGQRGVETTSGTPTISPWGNNITDVCIVMKEAEGAGMCQFIRPPNLDETIGVMDAKDIMVYNDGCSLTLQAVLDDPSKYSSYMGYDAVDLGTKENERVVVRFQTCWVPLKKSTSTTQIVPQHYSYQTRDRENPRNFILLGTPNGIYAHNDDVGGNKLFAHSVMPSGEVMSHWFEAEANKDCMVGHAATAEAGMEHPQKKAKTVEMGIRGMGPRTNCFVTVAVPNKQKAMEAVRGFDDDDDDDYGDGAPIYRSLSPVGKSYAARVSVAEDSVGTVANANGVAIMRSINGNGDSEPIVVTVLTYNTVEVPEDFEGNATSLRIAKTDVALGVADLDWQYKLVEKNGGVVCKLSQLPAMLHKLTEDDLKTISKKVKEDPAPPSVVKADPMAPNKSALSAFM